MTQSHVQNSFFYCKSEIASIRGNCPINLFDFIVSLSGPQAHMGWCRSVIGHPPSSGVMTLPRSKALKQPMNCKDISSRATMLSRVIIHCMSWKLPISAWKHSAFKVWFWSDLLGDNLKWHLNELDHNSELWFLN